VKRSGRTASAEKRFSLKTARGIRPLDMRNIILLSALFSGGALAQPAATGQFLLRIEPTRTGFTLQNMTADEGRLATQHVQYLMSLLDSGKLSLAAQVFDPKGLWGIIIVNAPDRETARVLLDGDPMVKANMFRGEVIPLRVVLEKPAEAAKPAATVDPNTLESYSGAYKSDQVPLDIKAFVRDGKLFLQATGQPELPLKAVSATQFEFAQAGIVVEFDSSSSFTLKQRGVSSRFKKAVAQ
jgi:uncharacterized protein YciI